MLKIDESGQWVYIYMVIIFLKFKIISLMCYLRKGLKWRRVGNRQLFINLCISPLLLKMCEHFSLFFWNSRNKTVKENNGVWFKDCFHRRPRTSWLLKRSKSSQGKGAGLTFQAQETASPKPSGTWSPSVLENPS